MRANLNNSTGCQQYRPHESLWMVPSIAEVHRLNATTCQERRKGVIARGALSGTSMWRPQSRYTVSRIECRINLPQNQRCRAKIALHPQIKVSHFSLDPPVALSFHAFAAGSGPTGGVAAGWWRISRHF